MPDLYAPTVYRGITIARFDIPASPYAWADQDSGEHGCAPTLTEAKRQIGQHLGPQGGAESCPECGGTGFEDWSGLSIVTCDFCYPED